jgi:hypothetical protein
MISCNLQGGLGNQLFQIAATHALALKNGYESAFNLRNCYTPAQGNAANNYKNTIFSKLNLFESHEFKNRYIEPSFSYHELPNVDDLLLTGYFQSERYFKEYENEIKELFTIPLEIYNIIRRFLIKKNYNIEKIITSVHIRRGDYLNLSEYHRLCALDYYHKAMEIIKSDYYVFVSDDIEWVKENFSGPNFIFSEFNDELLDFTLLSSCHNNIIANSSFSWWAAWLNQDPKKIVIAPNEWFGPLGPKDTQDIIPKNWITIDNKIK